MSIARVGGGTLPGDCVGSDHDNPRFPSTPLRREAVSSIVLLTSAPFVAGPSLLESQLETLEPRGSACALCEVSLLRRRAAGRWVLEEWHGVAVPLLEDGFDDAPSFFGLSDLGDLWPDIRVTAGAPDLIDHVRSE